jgi:hypothetical protein
VSSKIGLADDDDDDDAPEKMSTKSREQPSKLNISTCKQCERLSDSRVWPASDASRGGRADRTLSERLSGAFVGPVMSSCAKPAQARTNERLEIALLSRDCLQMRVWKLTTLHLLQDVRGEDQVVAALPGRGGRHD